jgi:hypothetical protein
VRAGVAHRQHLLGVFLPVRREPQHGPGAQLGRQHRNEFGLDQAPFMMPLLVPGIRKKHQNFIE